MYGDDIDIKIVELWDQGYGSGSIALKLKVGTGYITFLLRRLGLKRTPEETRALRKKNNIKSNYGNKPL